MKQRDDTFEKGLSLLGKLVVMLIINAILVTAIIVTGIFTVSSLSSGDFNYYYGGFLGVLILLVILVNTERGNKIIFKALG